MKLTRQVGGQRRIRSSACSAWFLPNLWILNGGTQQTSSSVQEQCLDDVGPKPSPPDLVKNLVEDLPALRGKLLLFATLNINEVLKQSWHRGYVGS